MENVRTIKLIIVAAALAVIAGLLLMISSWFGIQKHVQAINNFQDCADAGYAVMESYPAQCRTPDGRLFVQQVNATDNNASTNPNETSNSDTGAAIHANGCAVAGCSGQLCVSASEAGNIVSTCEYRAEYACYKEASCEPQADGKCGWTQTSQLKACLANPPQSNNSEPIPN